MKGAVSTGGLFASGGEFLKLVKVHWRGVFVTHWTQLKWLTPQIIAAWSMVRAPPAGRNVAVRPPGTGLNRLSVSRRRSMDGTIFPVPALTTGDRMSTGAAFR